MRIIAGKHRGRKLGTPSNDAIRPTTDRIRESLFSILGDMHGLIVIDGYAGTGALGCESLSRGADKVWFFEADATAAALVRSNLETLGELDAATVVQARFDRAVGQVDQAVDIVFLDPPYGSDEPSKALAALAELMVITPDTRIVLEQDKADDVPQQEAFEVYDERVYGSTRLSFLYSI